MANKRRAQSTDGMNQAGGANASGKTAKSVPNRKANAIPQADNGGKGDRKAS